MNIYSALLEPRTKTLFLSLALLNDPKNATAVKGVVMMALQFAGQGPSGVPKPLLLAIRSLDIEEIVWSYAPKPLVQETMRKVRNYLAFCAQQGDLGLMFEIGQFMAMRQIQMGKEFSKEGLKYILWSARGGNAEAEYYCRVWPFLPAFQWLDSDFRNAYMESVALMSGLSPFLRGIVSEIEKLSSSPTMCAVTTTDTLAACELSMLGHPFFEDRLPTAVVIGLLTELLLCGNSHAVYLLTVHHWKCLPPSSFKDNLLCSMCNSNYLENPIAVSVLARNLPDIFGSLSPLMALNGHFAVDFHCMEVADSLARAGNIDAALACYLVTKERWCLVRLAAFGYKFAVDALDSGDIHPSTEECCFIRGYLSTGLPPPFPSLRDSLAINRILE
jgi:hypothetical protein